MVTNDLICACTVHAFVTIDVVVGRAIGTYFNGLILAKHRHIHHPYIM